MVSEVAKVGLRASSSQVTLVWWPGRWHIFELWGNCAFFVSPKRAGFGWSLDNEAVPSPRQGKRARRVCACFTRSCLCWAGGVCRWLGLWVNVVLCTLVCATARVLAQECRGRACVPARCVHAVLVAGGTEDPLAGHPCVLTCPLQGSLPRDTLSWCGRRGLHNLCPTALFSVGPSTRWAQPLSKVTVKWQQLWYLLAPPGAQVKGVVASQRREPERPLVC